MAHETIAYMGCRFLIRKGLWGAALLSCAVLLLFTPVLRAEPEVEVATFGGGCFWCMEPPFDAVPGVLSTTSGFMGGTTENAHYKLVSSGRTKHVEVLHVKFDRSKVSYNDLLDVYWENSDPLTSGGQFCDMGTQYRPVIFYHSENQKLAAEESKEMLSKKLHAEVKGPIVTAIEPALQFFPAEEYHQNYYKKNPENYYRYRKGCGRDARLKELWGDKKTKAE